MDLRHEDSSKVNLPVNEKKGRKGTFHKNYGVPWTAILDCKYKPKNDWCWMVMIPRMPTMYFCIKNRALAEIALYLQDKELYYANQNMKFNIYQLKEIELLNKKEEVLE